MQKPPGAPRAPLLAFIGLLLACLIQNARAAELFADLSVPNGRLRALHGINKGPLASGGLIDLTQEHKALGVPFTRLHDCGWPNPYVVDHHAVFPNPDADPALPESYDFRLTDEYINAVRKTGAEPIYRLGESIEHTTVKRFVHPPKDAAKWAAICIGIIRHYNEGWANGFHHGIRYWEIWNEPENRPAMWSGTDEDYLQLYRVAGTAIKARFPDLKVGGPALGASGSFVHGEFRPTDFVLKFLAMCRQDKVPLNFFSWHCYTADPAELSARAHAVRRLLDSKGFTETESHLNEWNYLPGNTWKPISKGASAIDRERFYREMSGDAGAAFLLTSLLELQDAPVDVGNFFHGEVGGFGLFSEQGVPQPAYRAFRAFQELAQHPRRVATRGAAPGKSAFAAGLSADGREAIMLVSKFSTAESDFALQWKGFAWTEGVQAEIELSRGITGRAREEGGSAETGSPRRETFTGDSGLLRVHLEAPGFAVIRLRPLAPDRARPTLSISAPAHRIVYQRNLDNTAAISVSGQCAWPGATVEARIVDAATGQSGEWTSIGAVQADSSWRGQLRVPAGWYQLEVRARAAEKTATASVERFGVGEVFVVVGHSVAHGGGINLPGASDDRVNTVALPSGDMELRRQYKFTGRPELLPPLVGTQFGSNVLPAPAGNGTYFWAGFAERVAKSQNVPVLLFNAAFGGTSLEHWAKSARGEPFKHPFVSSALRMPYIRLQHALTRYCAVTGLRAILADQGQNDWPEPDPAKIVANYTVWIEQARHDANAPDLTVVVNRQSPPDGTGSVRRAQDEMIARILHCFPGPDYDTFAKEDTTDRVHLSEAGARKAAALWADALTADFFRNAKPLIAK
jgi:hypothetical protein